MNFLVQKVINQNYSQVFYKSPKKDFVIVYQISSSYMLECKECYLERPWEQEYVH